MPIELIRRAYIIGYEAIAITDHVDTSNIDFVIPRIIEVSKGITDDLQITVIAGAEITHVPPKMIGVLVKKARELGAEIVVVHGETIVEPVAPGTNRAAIDAGADILAHPGLISREDVLKARDNGVALEISSRKGHSLSNGHVARIAMDEGARLVINTDTHTPDDLITTFKAKTILRASGIPEKMIEEIFENSRRIVERIKSS
ncbi:MAG: histidinol phosphate phosphatase domain-containing protein [Thermodesulfovibrionia bacterium]